MPEDPILRASHFCKLTTNMQNTWNHMDSNQGGAASNHFAPHASDLDSGRVQTVVCKVQPGMQKLAKFHLHFWHILC